MPDLHGSRRAEFSLVFGHDARSHLVRSSEGVGGRVAARTKKGKKKKKMAASRRRPLNYNGKCQQVKRVWIVTIGSPNRGKNGAGMNIAGTRAAPSSIELLPRASTKTAVLA